MRITTSLQLVAALLIVLLLSLFNQYAKAHPLMMPSPFVSVSTMAMSDSCENCIKADSVISECLHLSCALTFFATGNVALGLSESFSTKPDVFSPFFYGLQPSPDFRPPKSVI